MSGVALKKCRALPFFDTDLELAAGFNNLDSGGVNLEYVYSTKQTTQQGFF